MQLQRFCKYRIQSVTITSLEGTCTPTKAYLLTLSKNTTRKMHRCLLFLFYWCMHLAFVPTSANFDKAQTKSCEHDSYN